jgi:hypothetical protein
MEIRVFLWSIIYYVLIPVLNVYDVLILIASVKKFFEIFLGQAVEDNACRTGEVVS